MFCRPIPAILLLSLALFFVSCTNPTQSTVDRLSLDVAISRLDTICSRYTTIGYTEPRRLVDISPRISGNLLVIDYAPGEVVRSGERLFEIDRQLLIADQLAAEAALASAEAQLIEARSNYTRALPLAAIEAISASQMDSYASTYRAAEATVAGARQQVISTRTKSDYATIYAPATGVISRCSAEEGDFVGVGTQFSTLATLAVTDSVAVRLDLPISVYMRAIDGADGSADMRNIISDVVMWLSDGSRYPFTGVYDYTLQQVSTSSGSVQLRVNFPNPQYRLKGGEYARVEYSVGAPTQVVTIPAEAVTSMQGVSWVWVVSRDSTVSQRRIVCGDMANNRYTVLNGLDADEMVVREASIKLRNGEKITINRVYNE